MTLSFETLLVLGILGFYLYDSAMLVFFNEIVFVEAFGRWSAICPGTHWRLRGKLPYMPNPLAPSSLVFRVAWSATDNSLVPETEAGLVRFMATIKILRPLAVVLMTLLILVLPVVMFRLGAGTEFIFVLTLVYLNIITMLILVYRKRENLGLDNRAFAVLAFDSLACAPFAINLVRKISLGYALCNNPVEFAHKHLERGSFEQLIKALDKKISEELEYEQEGSPRSLELLSYRGKFPGMMS